MVDFYNYEEMYRERPELLEPLEGGEPVMSQEFSEDSLALNLQLSHGASLRYVAEWNSWMAWDGKVWAQERTHKVWDLVRKVCREAAGRSEKDAIRTRLLAAHTVTAAELMARADRQFAATTDIWNSDPLQLNCPNGTLDLRTGELLPHKPLSFHTKITEAAFPIQNLSYGSIFWIASRRRQRVAVVSATHGRVFSDGINARACAFLLLWHGIERQIGFHFDSSGTHG